MTKNLKNILRAASMEHDARLIVNHRGGFRKHHPMGGTWSPVRVIMIDNKSYSFAGARQYLKVSVN